MNSITTREELTAQAKAYKENQSKISAAHSSLTTQAAAYKKKYNETIFPIMKAKFTKSFNAAVNCYDSGITLWGKDASSSANTYKSEGLKLLDEAAQSLWQIKDVVDENSYNENVERINKLRGYFNNDDYDNGAKTREIFLNRTDYDTHYSKDDKAVKWNFENLEKQIQMEETYKGQLVRNGADTSDVDKRISFYKERYESLLKTTEGIEYRIKINDTKLKKLEEEYKNYENQTAGHVTNYDKRGGTSGESESHKIAEKKRSYEGEITALKNVKKSLKEQLKFSKTYGKLSLNEDFAENSNVDIGVDDPLYKYINNIDDYRNSSEEGYRKWGTSGSGAGSVFVYYKDEYKKENYDQILPEEIKAYNYIYKTEGSEAAQTYLNKLKETFLDDRYRYDEYNANAAYAKENPILGSIATVFANVGDTLLYLPKLMDPDNQELNKLSHFVSDVRGTVAEGIDNDFGRLAYQGVMSISDMGVAIGIGYLTGGSSYVTKISSGLMSLSSASSTLTDARDRGLDEWQAVSLSVCAGLIEYATEKCSLDNLFSNPKGFVSAFVKQVAAEGSEEVVSELANNWADTVISGDQSKINQRVAELMENEGKSYKEASKKALEEFWVGVGEAGIVGMMSGGFFGVLKSVSYAKNAIKFKKYANTVNSVNGGAEQLTNFANVLQNNTSDAVLKLTLEKGVENYNSEKTDRSLGLLYNIVLDAADRKMKTAAKSKNTSVINRAYSRLLEQAEEAGATELFGERLEKMKNNAAAYSGIDKLRRAAGEDAIEISELRKQEIKENAEQFGEFAGDFVNTFMLNPNTDINSFKNGFAMAFNLGAAGATIEAAEVADQTGALTEPQILSAYEAGARALEKRKAAARKTDGGYVSFEERADENSDGIKMPEFSAEIINKNMIELTKMKPVYDVSESKLEKTGKRPDVIFREVFNSWGNIIKSKLFGDIAAGNSSVRSEIRHGLTGGKIASIEAIPTVINEGKVIFAEKKTSDSAERIVVCAPIRIGIDNYYMGVMLQRDSANQRLYLHDVVLESEINKETPGIDQANLVTNRGPKDTERLFMTSIIQKALSVKTNYTQTNSNLDQNQTNIGVKKSGPDNATFNKKGTVTYDSSVDKKNLKFRQRQLIKVIDFIARATGINFELFQSEVKGGKYIGESGSFNFKTNAIRIDVNAGKSKINVGYYAMLRTVSHELTHFIAHNNEADFLELQEFVFEHIGKEKAANMLENRMKKGLTPEQAAEEVVAYGCEMMLENSKAIETLAKQNASLANRIKNFISDFIKRLKDGFEGVDAVSDEAQELLEYAEDMQKLWDKGLVGAVHNHAAEDSSKSENVSKESSESETEAKDKSFENKKSLEDYIDEEFERSEHIAENYDIPDDSELMFEERKYNEWIDFIEEISDVEAKKNQEKGTYIKISDKMPKILKKYGAGNHPLIIRFDAMYLAQRKSGALEGHYHHLGKDIMSNLFEYLSDPDLILETVSKKGKTRLQIIVGIPVKEGELDISVEINTIKDISSNYDYCNLVVTVFDIKKKPFSKLFSQYDASLKYKKETLSQVNPQLHEWLSIVNDSVSKNIIPDTEQNVNNNSKNNLEDSNIMKEERQSELMFEERDYSYDELRVKKEITVEVLPDTALSETRMYERDTVLFGKEMVKIARSVKNPQNTTTATYLHCKDLGGDILITRNSFKHGADRSMDSLYVSVCKALPEVLKNSIAVNELKPRGKETNGSYILLGLAEHDGKYVVVRSIVNKKTWKLEDYNELYAIKKEDVGLQAPALPQKEGYVTSSTISISDFLQIVNRADLANIVLSKDVIDNLNSNRKFDKKISPDLMFEERQSELSDEQAVEQALKNIGKSEAGFNHLKELSKLYSEAHKLQSKINHYEKAIRQEAKKRTSELISKEDKNKSLTLSSVYENSLSKLKRDFEQVNSKISGLGKISAVKSTIEEIKAKHKSEVRGEAEKTLNIWRDERAKTDVLDKIRRLRQNIASTLASNNKQKHVPLDLMETAKSLLEMVEDNSSSDIRVKERLNKFEAIYKSIKSNPEYDSKIKQALDPELLAEIQSVKDKIGDKTLGELSVGDLEKIYEISVRVDHAIKNSNKFFSNTIKATIDEAGKAIFQDIRTQRKGGKKSLDAFERLKDSRFNFYKPLQFFKMIGSKTLLKIYDNLHGSEERFAIDIQRIHSFKLDAAKEHGIKNADLKTKKEYKLTNGENVILSTGQIMSLYAYSKRTQAMLHLTEGGFIQPDGKVKTERLQDENGKKKLIDTVFSFSIKDSTAHKLTDGDIETLILELSKEQKDFVDKMQKYLSVEMAALGNEVTLKLNGVVKFTEQNYFPIRTAADFIAFKEGGENAMPSLTTPGFAHDTIERANNPLVLDDFLSTWGSHTTQMAMYHSTAGALNDFQKILNYQNKVYEEVETEDGSQGDKITLEMGEVARYRILKDKKINLAQINAEEYERTLRENPEITDGTLKKKEAQKLLKRIGEEFEVFGEYENSDFQLEFSFGKNNLDESVHKQKGNYDVYEQMLSCFSEIITNAVGIEVHNRNKAGYKTNPTLKNVYVLCSAFDNGNLIIPVKLEVKEFSDKPNRLYVAVSLDGIEKDRVVGMGVPNNRSHVRTSPVSDISISELFSNVNTKDGNFLKYLPNQFLSAAQVEAKNKVLSKDGIDPQSDLEKSNVPLKLQTAEHQSIMAEIEQVFGKGSKDYIERFLADVNGGIKNNEIVFAQKMLSNFKKAKVFLSRSVFIQQFSAFARAFVYLGPTDFIKTAHKGLVHQFTKRLSKEKLNEWEELKKYCPVAAIKEMGYFDINMGRSGTDFVIAEEYMGLKEKTKAFFSKDGSFRDEVFSYLPAKADEATWCWIWRACQQKAKRSQGFKIGTEKNKLAAAELFTETIRNTQVYDSVFSRAQIMRSKSTFHKMATAFMAEPLTSLNMLMEAIDSKDKKKIGKTAAALFTSALLNAMLYSIVAVSRDDEDEEMTWAEKYISHVAVNFVDGVFPLNWIPFVKDVTSIIEGYKIERTDLSLIGDLADGVFELFDENKNFQEKITPFITAFADCFGIPLSNLYREVKSIENLFDRLNNGSKTSLSGIKEGLYLQFSDMRISSIFNPKSKNELYIEELYNAALLGDEKEYKRVYDRLIKSGKNEKQIQSAIGKYLKDNDERIAEANTYLDKSEVATDEKEAIKWEDKYNAIIDELIEDGFELETVISASKSYKEKEEKLLENEINTKTEKTAEKYKASVYDVAVFNLLSRKEQSDILDKIESFAKAETKDKLDKSYDMPLSQRKASIAKEVGITPAEYFTIIESTAKNTLAAKYQAINKSNLDKNEKQAMKRIVKAGNKNIDIIEKFVKENYKK